MISYLLYTTLCTGLVLLFYYYVLASETTYQINRWYLVIGLFSSMLIPIIPIGLVDFSWLFDSSNNIQEVFSISQEQINVDSLTKDNSKEKVTHLQSLNGHWAYQVVAYLYGIVTLLLFVRFFKQLYQMQIKALRNPATSYNGHKVVLLEKEVIPHTFGKTIFVNKKQFKRGNISDEMLKHELIHAKQNHYLDILFVEIIKTIYWFNPILYLFKKTIQLNHEYIADNKVLSEGIDITTYQTALLSFSKAKSASALSTSLNVNLTKKRFKMMTSNTSRLQSYLKATLIIPFLVLLGITFGCEPAGMEENNKTNTVNVEFLGSETIKLNGQTISASQFESAFTNLSIDPSNTVVDLKIYGNPSVGTVTDIQEILRKQGALRINYSKEESDESKSANTHSSILQGRNILNIFINEKGDILVNQTSTQPNSVDRLVKEFLTNNGKSTNLSENPSKAIIAFRTNKNTPYNTFTKTLEKVMVVYKELRNQASIESYGKQYESLAKGSPKKQHINDLYPKRISIQEPSGN